MRNKSFQILVVPALLLMFGVGGLFHDSAKEDRELLSSELEEVTFSRERRDRTEDPSLVLCYHCEHTFAKRNYDCSDPINPTFLVLVQCNGTCMKVTWIDQNVTQYIRTCLANTPCFTERVGKLYQQCCRSDECNGTDASRRPPTAILAIVVFQVVRASRRFYLRFS